ncbi:MAG: hypothetical protein EBY45_15710 [Gammaproteobacteria bacterium]|nr:hypothetical protein [Gammaproteobacteria bacterium]
MRTNYELELAIKRLAHQKTAGLFSAAGRLAGGALGAIGRGAAAAAKPTAKAFGKGVFNTSDMIGKGVNRVAGGAVKAPLNFASGVAQEIAPNSPIAQSISKQFTHGAQGVTNAVNAMNSATNPVARAIRAGTGAGATYKAVNYATDDRRKHTGKMILPTWGERH